MLKYFFASIGRNFIEINIYVWIFCIWYCRSHVAEHVKRHTTVQSGCRSDTKQNETTVKVSQHVWHVFTWRDQQECTNEVCCQPLRLVFVPYVRRMRYTTKKENQNGMQSRVFRAQCVAATCLCKARRILALFFHLSNSLFALFTTNDIRYINSVSRCGECAHKWHVASPSQRRRNCRITIATSISEMSCCQMVFEFRWIQKKRNIISKHTKKWPRRIDIITISAPEWAQINKQTTTKIYEITKQSVQSYVSTHIITICVVNRPEWPVKGEHASHCVGVCVDFTACRFAVPLKTNCKSYKKTNEKSRVFIYAASVFGFSLLLDVDVFAHSNR